MKRACFAIGASFFVMASTMAACSGSSSGGGTPLVTETDSGPGPGSGPDATMPPGTGVADLEPCYAQIRFDQRCADSDAGASSACADARKKDCGKFVSGSSDVYLKASVACFADTTMCDSVTTCIDGK